jgi:hypothetical protein
MMTYSKREWPKKEWTLRLSLFVVGYIAGGISGGIQQYTAVLDSSRGLQKATYAGVPPKPSDLTQEAFVISDANMKLSHGNGHGRSHDSASPSVVGTDDPTGAGPTEAVDGSSENCVPYVQENPAFDKVAHFAFDIFLEKTDQTERRQFNASEWGQKTSGGLEDADRNVIAHVYSNANSVFEFGLGESTYIANQVNVPRYSGVDSDPQWVAKARARVSSNFRFYFADVGKTQAWGYPQRIGPKAIFDYQIAPLVIEPLPFDVYLVDGRWRVGSLLTSFLHASARGEKILTDTIVLLHDCHRKNLRKADQLFEVHQPGNSSLCAFRRRPETTDQDIMEMWKANYKQAA